MMIINPDDLVECYDSIAVVAPSEELGRFFSDHGFSPDDWFAWEKGVDVYLTGETLTWRPGDRIVWDTLRSCLSRPLYRDRVPEEELVPRQVSRHRTKHYIRQGDLEFWVDCPDEGVLVSNHGRVRSTSKGKTILKLRRGGKVSGPWVKAHGRTVYVRDLMRKYIVSVPGMV